MSTRFEKLVKLSGTNLTQSVYPMITYVQVTDDFWPIVLTVVLMLRCVVRLSVA